MIRTIIILTIINIYVIPFFTTKEELPIDTSQDILSEGISDPAWITNTK